MTRNVQALSPSISKAFMPELQEAAARCQVGYLHWIYGWRLRQKPRNVVLLSQFYSQTIHERVQFTLR